MTLFPASATKTDTAPRAPSETSTDAMAAELPPLAEKLDCEPPPEHPERAE